MQKKKDLNIQITELFMAKAGKTDFARCFHGTIKREKDENGNPVVRGKIFVKDETHCGYIYAMADDQWLLGDILDELVLMILDEGLHSNAGIKIKICDTDFFLN